MIKKVLDSYREAFEGLPASVWLMSFVVMINRCGTMVMPFLALYATDVLGLEDTQYGYLLCFFGVGGIAGSYLGGYWVKKLGSFPYMMIALSVSAPLFLLLGFLTNYYALAFFLPILAIATESARPATSTAVTELCRPALHTKALALLRTAVNLGMAIGPVIGGAVYHFGFIWLVSINGFFNLATAGLVFYYFGKFKSPSKEEKVRPELAGSSDHTEDAGISPFRDGTYMLATLLNIIAGIGFFQLMGIYPVFIRDKLGWSEFQIGLALAVNTILIVAVEMVIVDRIKKRNPLVMVGIGNGLMMFGFGATAFAVGLNAYLAALVVVGTIVVWTIGEIVSMPLMLAYTSQKATAKTRSQYMGVMGMSFSIAMLISPIVGTRLYSMDPMLPWYIMIISSVPLAVLFWTLSMFDKTMLITEDDEKDLVDEKTSIKESYQRDEDRDSELKAVTTGNEH